MSTDFDVPKSAGEQQKSLHEKMADAQKILDQQAEARKQAETPSAPEEEENEGAEIEEEPDLYPEIELTEEDKTSFFESVLAGVPYSEEYPLFGGQMQILLRVRRAEEAEAALTAAGKIVAPSVIEYEAVFALHNLACALVAITSQKGVVRQEGQPEKERVAYLRNMPSPLYTVLLEKMSFLDRKAAKLSRAASKPNFWHPASES